MDKSPVLLVEDDDEDAYEDDNSRFRFKITRLVSINGAVVEFEHGKVLWRLVGWSPPRSDNLPAKLASRRCLQIRV